MKKFTALITSVLVLLLLQTSAATAITVKNNSENMKGNKKEKDIMEYYSDKKLGSFIEGGKTYFRLFAPSAVEVHLITFKNIDEMNGTKHLMKADEDGVWETSFEGEHNGLYYGFKVYHKGDEINGKKPLCVDPYAKAVATYNSYMNPRKSIVYTTGYDWEGDKWIQRDWRDLIVYEMHIRDMTAHKSSGASQPGTYNGLVERGIRGGIDYIKELGVNTVELLPSQEFGCIEIPFHDTLKGKFNTWNPYERNHWGYMTSNYFAPEAYYSMDWDTLKWNTWMGHEAKQVKQFKNMVKEFHKEGIAVIMDVVYNHLSEYELGNLKEIDKEYYFRLDDNGNFIAESYCGNDLKTEAPMMRRLIVESILYWMQEYHIDGFRFDLGHLIDWKTIETIIAEAKKINPDVIFVCEPWGGGYDPQGFSQRGWGAWNDQIRNGIKGENPNDGHGWIFGKWYGNNSPQRIKSYVNGTLIKDEHGLFQKKEHSVNYLASHDGYTFGDFIRIGTGDVKADDRIQDVDENVKLNNKQMKLNKLGAMFLLTSQGITMIHSGQEFARSKVIPFDIEIPDKHRGMIDHNSYEKDNSTNFINYEHAEINKELLDYYKGLIEIRKKYSAFRHADYSAVSFVDDTTNSFALAYKLDDGKEVFFVAFNANQKKKQKYVLPEGGWEVIADKNSAGLKIIETKTKTIELEPVTGMILRKRK